MISMSLSIVLLILLSYFSVFLIVHCVSLKQLFLVLYWGITDLHVFGVSYWESIVILLWCPVFLFFHIP